MPTVPRHSPATHKPVPQYYIHTASSQFVDTAGRTLILRGVNLSGASKAPVNHLSHVLEDFWDSVVPYEDDDDDGASSSSSSSRTRNGKGKSFIGRPLNLDDGSADIHLARLRAWGFNLFRFVFTWEALEHEGPGKYDYEFIDYTIRVLQKCKDYGFRVYMDPHQDTWSRFSGGSGAPYWTLPACGIDPLNITATQSAIVHCEYTPLSSDEDATPDPAVLPAMIWSTNYGRLLSQTIFTLFFAGRSFAPKCIINGMNIQDFLQSHYLNAIRTLASAILEYDNGSLYDECIIGWDSMNEPFEGLVGWEDLNLNPKGQGSTLKRGTAPTPAQSLRLGMGQKQKVEVWDLGSFGPKKTGNVVVDPKGKKVWAENKENAARLEEGNPTRPRRRRPIRELANGHHPYYGWTRNVNSWPLGKCIWALHGVWDIETGFILQPDYFRFDPSTGVEVEFVTDFWKAHFLEYQKVIRQFHPESIWFVQPPVFVPPPRIKEDESEEGGDGRQLVGLHGRACYSTHYYDGLTLITRHWNWFNADALGILRGKYSSVYQAMKIGEAAIRKSLGEQLGMLRDDAKILGAYPTVIGEIGIPFDMDDKRAYMRGERDRRGDEKYLGVYDRQERALDASLNACDGVNGLSYTMWTFCPDDHSHAWSDGWNLEDLSLWSPDDVWARRIGDIPDDNETVVDDRIQECDEDEDSDGGVGLRARGRAPYRMNPSYSTSTLGTVPTMETLANNGPASDSRRLRFLGYHQNPYDFLRDGSRAVRAFCRPFPVKTVGTPVGIEFDMPKALFRLRVLVTPEDGVALRNAEVKLATEVYIPLVHYAHPRLLASADGHGSGKKQLAGVTAGFTSTTTLMGEVYEQDDGEVVDIDVVATPGTNWTLRGQTLSWWYSAPAVGDGEIEYTLEVRRRGGPIKHAVNGREDPVSRPLKVRSLTSNKKPRSFTSFCEAICCPGSDSGCVLM